MRTGKAESPALPPLSGWATCGWLPVCRLTRYLTQGAATNGSYAGEDIKISEDIQEILDFVNSTSKSHVVQQYLQAPLLLPGDRKFDIRYSRK